MTLLWDIDMVANDGKVVELHYDLMTGQRVKSAKQ